MSLLGQRCPRLTRWIGLGLTLLMAGCQLQIAFVEPSSKKTTPPTQETQMARMTPANGGRPGQGEIVRTAGELPPPGYIQGGVPLNSPPSNQPIPHYSASPNGLPQPILNGPALNGAMPHGAMPDHGPGPEMAMAPPGPMLPPTGYVPTEKAKTSMPPYVIEPPDILLIDPIRMLPRPPYIVQPLDVLLVRVADPLPNQPIEGPYTVSPDGVINLGYNYGVVRVAGMTLEDIERAIRGQLGRVLKDPQVAVGLAQYRGIQQVRGEHLVRPDGTISLGSYGCVYVAGLTLAQAKVAIERHLCQHLLEPEVSVDVFAYNSKVYYVITDGAGYGMSVFRFPVTGNETVLDAISNIQGLPAVASRKKIWVARPAPAGHPCSQILPVDWLAITEGGVTGTNYQLFPGDRVYVQSDPLIKLDNVIAKVLAPFERIMGFALISTAVWQNTRNNGGGTGVGFIAQ